MANINVTSLSKEELLNLDPNLINWELNDAEVFHIFGTMGGWWAYSYPARLAGKSGLHAKLKSERCSDGFLYSKAVLRHVNLRRIFARQLVLRFNKSGLPKPDFVTGIPDGATELGRDFADVLGVKFAEMAKVDGKIKLVTEIPPGSTLLIVEDFCTKATGFRETIKELGPKISKIQIYPWELVIVNRGGLTEIEVEGVGVFYILAMVTHRINDWDPDECILCHPELDQTLPKGVNVKPSGKIKPKSPEENWDIITRSQL